MASEEDTQGLEEESTSTADEEDWDSANNKNNKIKKLTKKRLETSKVAGSSVQMGIVKRDPDNDTPTRDDAPTSQEHSNNKEDPYVTILVHNSNDNNQEQSLQFKLKKNANFKKLTQAYCKRFNLNHAETRFLYDGERLGDNTPETLGMRNGDIIEAMCKQDGGGSSY